ncbi:MAG: hypothetical protein EBS30_01455 [Planctomycetes bacterium]|nr:hypothetical protein [Planctomycetota bacterium]
MPVVAGTFQGLWEIAHHAGDFSAEQGNLMGVRWDLALIVRLDVEQESTQHLGIFFIHTTDISRIQLLPPTHTGLQIRLQWVDIQCLKA